MMGYFEWWMLPLAITVLLWAWPIRAVRQPSYGAMFHTNGIFETFGAIIGTLFAWLVWALFA